MAGTGRDTGTGPNHPTDHLTIERRGPMAPSITDPRVAEATWETLPAKVREAVDKAIDARRRFHAAFSMPAGVERINVRRAAVNDLAAANRVLGAYDSSLPQQVARAALGGAR